MRYGNKEHYFDKDALLTAALLALLSIGFG
jgi:hypothetical protein